MKNKILILSIDGGGIRGIIPVQFLKYIERITSKSTIEIFDLFAGTSTGGLIACALTARDLLSVEPKYKIKDLENFFHNDSKIIFPIKYSWQKTYYRFPLSKFWWSRFGNKGLIEVIKKIFCNIDNTEYDYRLSDCIKPVFISSYNLATNSPVIFSSRDAIVNPENDYRLLNVCLSTSAAPTYLPAYKFKEERNSVEYLCVDGGIFNNNPSVSALIEIYNNYNHPIYNYSKTELQAEDIFILSLGTGRYDDRMNEKNALSGGKYHWATKAIDLSLLASSQLNHYNAEEIFKSKLGINHSNYLRLDISIDEKKFEDMTFSDKKTLDYLERRFEIDFLTNTTLQTKLNDFLEKAGFKITI